MAIYCILYEEIIRDTYERLVELQKSKLRSLRGTVIELHRLTRRLARIDNFEHLKLPITREFGQSILQTKRQENIRQGIDDLKSLGQTTVVIMLSFAGVLIALIALAPNLSAIVSFLENIK